MATLSARRPGVDPQLATARHAAEAKDAARLARLWALSALALDVLVLVLCLMAAGVIG